MVESRAVVFSICDAPHVAAAAELMESTVNHMGVRNAERKISQRPGRSRIGLRCNRGMCNVTHHGWTGTPADFPGPGTNISAPTGNKYEEIALLDTSSKGSFSITAQGKTNAVIDRLKAEAAKLGANGILLSGVGDQAAGSVGSGFGTAIATGHSAFGVGFGSSATVFQKKGDGLAIYVEPDQIAAR